MQTRRHFLAVSAATLLTPLAVRAGEHARLATFTGASGHVASGRVEIAGTTITLLDDFRLDNGPDPKVALGRDGYDPATLMGPLESFSGTQSYTAPDGIDPADYNEVYIWCERFSVPLAVAKIN